ncbi:MAG TPA: hypothetical protein VGP90_13660, partial [Acidimicrobiia bacterium]|nr:hypothetical protein [Acidimicrobiia bacterium]
MVAGALFAAAWACFAALTLILAHPPAAADLARLDQLLSQSAAVLALLLVTLSVTDLQVSGARPRPSVVAVVALGLGQGGLALTLGSAGAGLWPAAAHVLSLIGLAVALLWVASAFQCGVRGQRAERRASVIAAWTDRARHQARQTVQTTYRHDVRSMLFALDGATRVLGDPAATLSPAERAGFAKMSAEAVARLSALIEVHPEEIAAFDLEAAVRAVAHAERKAGRRITPSVPAGLRTVGRVADVVAVLRTLVDVVAATHGDVRIRAEADGPAVSILVEPAATGAVVFSPANWGSVELQSPNWAVRDDDGDAMDLYVAVRLL